MTSRLSQTMRSKFKAVTLLACILLSVVSLAEEASRLINNAVASKIDAFKDNWAPNLNDLEFHFSALTTGGGKKELSFHLTEPFKFKTITTLNDRRDNGYSKSWNDASIWLGTDKTYLSTALTECIFNRNDSFLWTLPPDCQDIESSVISLRRDSFSGFSGEFRLFASEMLAYQCGLLTELIEINMTWSIEHTHATQTNTPDVLLTNNDARSPKLDRNAFTNSNLD